MNGPEEQPALNEQRRTEAEHLGPNHPNRPSRQLSTTRLEAFSDGVFAIAVTLLVLDLKVPESPERLLEQLFAEWPSFLGYLVSFAFISASWIAHAGLTHLLQTADGVFLGLNLLLLLFVSFLPFTTSLFTKHMTDSGELVSVVAFGLNLTLAALAFLITQPLWRLRRWGRARRHPEVSHPGPS